MFGMDKRLKLYAQRAWLPQNTRHTILLYPFWGNVALPISDPDYERFDDYLKEGSAFFELMEQPDTCDYFLLPFEFSFESSILEAAKKISKEAQRHNKKLIVFFNNDDKKPIPLNHAIVFRTSFFKSTQQKNEFAFPGWSVDFLKKYTTHFAPIEKQNLPHISYCGYVDYLDRAPSIKQRLFCFLHPLKKEEDDYGRFIRGKAVRQLHQSKKVKCDFIIREGFWAAGMEDKNKVRQDYAANMLNAPYAFVTRGAGNFSYRLIEIMSCGRIPVFINTDAVLPHEHLFAWKKQCVWIEEGDIKKIDAMLFEFHKNISPEKLVQLQHENRAIYEKFLSPSGYFKHLHTLL
jgi:hypothetical protein